MVTSIRNFYGVNPVCWISILICLCPIKGLTKEPLSLEQVVEMSVKNDPWLHGSRLTESALEAESIASGSLPDPTVSITMANLPTDTWDLSQETMTQFKLGVSQVFPRGNVLAIKQSQFKVNASKQSYLRENRIAKITAKVSQLWLDAFLAQQSIALIENDKFLFEQMVDAVKASYSVGSSNVRQQDVIRSQLELLRLDDRLTLYQQRLDVSIARLNEWLHNYNSQSNSFAINFDQQDNQISVSNTFPDVQLRDTSWFKHNQILRNNLATHMLAHPAVVALEIKQNVADKEIELANQQYKPQWAVNASYAVRDDTSEGFDRADLFSLGVSFDLPLFNSDSKDSLVAASIAKSETIKTEKLLLIKSMLASVEKDFLQLQRLSQRQNLYQEQLLRQSHQQAEATLSAYTNDDGDFDDVVQAKISELNTKITALGIKVDRMKAVIRINYFLVRTSLNNLQRLGM